MGRRCGQDAPGWVRGHLAGSCFFYTYFWTLQKSTAATAAAYINTVMFFFALPCFCVFPLIDATSILLI